MQEDEVMVLARDGYFNGRQLTGKVEETHISWVILTRYFAFKIKKPVKLSFLDFSTLLDRKRNCERELRLNRRFTQIYMSVVPVRRLEKRFVIGGNKGKIIDYAVQMKRMAADKQMDKVLAANGVKEEHIISLAKVVGTAHLNCKVVTSRFDLLESRDLFNDIRQVTTFVRRNLEIQFYNTINDAIQWNEYFLKKHAKRFQERISQGYKRDVHGDLHSGNIFLYKKPILFDCIEFNDSFRQIDLLYEVAFLCMDLEAFGMRALSKKFLSVYNSLVQCIEVYEDFEIFDYFKCLRANVRAKVHALAAMQAENGNDFQHHVEEFKKYANLMHTYIHFE